MSELDINLASLDLDGSARVLHKPGAVRLDDYPLLVYAPDQYGPGICTEDNGTPVADICHALAETPDLDALAERLGTTPAHVRQAVAYAHAAGASAPRE